MSITVWVCMDCGRIHDHKPDYKGDCNSCGSYKLEEKSLIQMFSDINMRLELLEKK